MCILQRPHHPSSRADTEQKVTSCQACDALVSEALHRQSPKMPKINSFMGFPPSRRHPRYPTCLFSPEKCRESCSRSCGGHRTLTPVSAYPEICRLKASCCGRPAEMSTAAAVTLYSCESQSPLLPQRRCCVYLRNKFLISKPSKQMR